MDGWTTALVSYLITILISLFVAGLIQGMVFVLSRFSKAQPAKADHNASSPENHSNDTAIAAAIAIAQNCQMVSEGNNR